MSLTSIVIPSVFNPEAVARVERLIAANTGPEHEVIVVDTTPNATGCVKPTNQGLAQAKGDVLVMMNDDCQPQPGWLEPLLDAVSRGVWLCSPTWQWARLGGHCLCMPRSTYESTGGLDERYTHWCSDHHLELQIYDLGGPVCQVACSEVVHDPGDPLRCHWRKSSFSPGHELLPNTGQWYLDDQAVFESIWGERRAHDNWPASWTTPA